MHVLVQLIRIGGTGNVQRSRCADKSPQSDTVVRNAIAPSAPCSRNLAGNYEAELESLGYEDTSAFLEPGEP